MIQGALFLSISWDVCGMYGFYSWILEAIVYTYPIQLSSGQATAVLCSVQALLKWHEASRNIRPNKAVDMT
jgi:hypothetical protein